MTGRRSLQYGNGDANNKQDRDKSTAGSAGTLLRFAVVGAITTAIDFVLFSTLVAVAVVPAFANVLSYSCGILVSYALNRSWTFRTGRSHVQGLKFVASTVTGMVLSTLIVTVFTSFLPAQTSKILSVPMVFVWNYLMARLWVFRT